MGLPERFYYRQRMQRRHSKEGIKSLLTVRQIEVLELAAMGLSNREIGKRLNLKPDTVNGFFKRKKDRKEIFDRLNAYSRREAVVKAISLGLLNPEALVSQEELERCKHLSGREIKILGLLASPLLSSLKSTKIEIAERLGKISPETVKKDLRLIYSTLQIEKNHGHGLKNTRAAVIYLAYEQRKLTSPFHERLHEPNGVDG